MPKLLDMVLSLGMTIPVIYVNQSKACRNRIWSAQFKDERCLCVSKKLLVFGFFFINIK